MSAKGKIVDRFDILLSIVWRYMNNFRKYISDGWTLNVPFHVSHSTWCKISHYLCDRILIDIINISYKSISVLVLNVTGYSLSVFNHYERPQKGLTSSSKISVLSV